MSKRFCSLPTTARRPLCLAPLPSAPIVCCLLPLLLSCLSWPSTLPFVLAAPPLVLSLLSLTLPVSDVRAAVRDGLPLRVLQPRFRDLLLGEPNHTHVPVQRRVPNLRAEGILQRHHPLWRGFVCGGQQRPGLHRQTQTSSPDPRTRVLSGCACNGTDLYDLSLTWAGGCSRARP